MPRHRDTATPTKPEGTPQRVFDPVMGYSVEAEQLVRYILKRKAHTIDIVGTEMAPLFGFGMNASHDVLIRSKCQAVFTSPDVTGPLDEFYSSFVSTSWGGPVADWDATLALVHEKRNEPEWAAPPPSHPVSDPQAPPEHHYARFLIRMLERLSAAPGPGAHMLKWLRSAVEAGKEDKVCWVLFHALMYLHLTKMEINKDRAPFKEVTRYYVDKMKEPKTFSDLLVRLTGARRSLT